MSDAERLSDAIKTHLTSDPVNHPSHYGGADNPYEVIKVINAWGLDFSLGNVVKYVARAGKKAKTTLLEDLKKARFYLDNKIATLETAESQKEQIEITTHKDSRTKYVIGQPICINCGHTHYYESGDRLPMGKCRHGCECSIPQYSTAS